MKGYVWFLNAIVTINSDIMEKMENEINAMTEVYENYVLSCKWNNNYHCIEFFPDGPWEC